MIWEGLLWAALALAGRPVAQRYWPRLKQRAGEWGPWLAGLAPWADGLLVPYLALISGSILGRDMGLYGQGAGLWLAGALACGLALGVLTLVLRRRHLSIHLNTPLELILDEPRWALYRAAIAQAAASFPAGILGGFLLASLEWCLRRRPWTAKQRGELSLWEPLLRAALSAALFAATRNLWLTAATQAALALLVRRRKA